MLINVTGGENMNSDMEFHLDLNSIHDVVDIQYPGKCLVVFMSGGVCIVNKNPEEILKMMKENK